MKNIARGDYTEYLYHLTLCENLLEILRTNSISGSISRTRLFKGKCISFTETPLPILARHHREYTKSGSATNYDLYGIGVKKSDILKMGGRPAIYQPKNEYEELPQNMRFRHVTYELEKSVDWTWEREWVLATDTLELNQLIEPLILVKKLEDMNDILLKFYGKYNSSNEFAIIADPQYFERARPFPYPIIPMEVFSF